MVLAKSRAERHIGDNRVSDDDVARYTGRWNYGSLPLGIRVGRDCYLERREVFERYRSVLDPGLILGDEVQVFSWTTFNVEPQGQVIIGDRSVLVGAVLMCARSITIGQRCLLSYNVTVADSDFHPIDPADRRLDAVATAPYGDPSKRPRIESASVTIGDDVWIGIGAIILKGVSIGDGAHIDAGAVVARNVPSGSVVRGNPAAIARD
jgi:acetyltransferase-like isoleucine patch superfamily enzyme